MKKMIFAGLLAVAGLGVAPLARAADVGVSISVGQPGFYGRIDLGRAPPPRLVYAEPVWVRRGPAYVEPVYLRVPPGHQRNWGRHCQRYDACGQPVYFVRDDWYRGTYVPYYRERHRHEGWRDERRDRRDHHHHDRDRGPHRHGRD